ncbi:MAG: M28 family peptidase [Candidatus Aminicenantes bacterium]|nr:M28 family peptidase [Candidatus Aminicenantes bacterium]
MKKILKWAAWILLVLVLLFGALVFYIVNPGWGMDSKQPRLPVQIPRLRADVEALCAISPSRDYLHPEALERAALYIVEQFKQAGWECSSQYFTVAGRSYQNIVARFGERNRERIVVGAHYDVCGPQPGADDNASGVAGLLELARLVSEQKPPLKHGLELVAYCLEEPPFFKTENMGSFIHVQSLRRENAGVKLMLCLEMIGYYSEQPGSQTMPFLLLKPFYPGRGNFIAIVGRLSDRQLVGRVKKWMRAGSRIDVRSINAPEQIPGIDFSDHLNYWRYDIPAVMITDTAFYRNPHYHEKSDMPQTLDFEKMSEVVRGVYWTVVNF